jgi:hypothetical protein
MTTTKLYAFPLLELEKKVEGDSQLQLMQIMCKELVQKMAEQLQKALADQKADSESFAAQKQMMLQKMEQLVEANKQVLNNHSLNNTGIRYLLSLILAPFFQF